jgi:lysophospholipase L1-like esterase
VLLSGGGNDIAGDEFPVLLNHRNSGLPVLNEKVVEGLVEVRLRQAMASLLGSISTLCQTYLGGARPILIHGYDYPVPDGRGYMGGAWILPGPWLEPGFRKKGHVAASQADRRRVLAANAVVMRELIERYNAMLKSVARSLPGVHYVDLRDKLSAELARDKYREDWNDELHPTKNGFRKVALAFARVLDTL